MKQVYIITEGITDQKILKTVLPQIVLKDVDFIVGAGKYSAQSSARSILAMEQVPVALVVDADTTIDAAVQEQRDFLQMILGQASFGVEFKVFLAIPEIEILLVQDWDFIKQLTAKPAFSEIETEFAQLHPKKFLLSTLEREPYDVLLQKLLEEISKQTQTLEIIRKHPLVKQLNEFLQSVINQSLEPSRRSTPYAADVQPRHV